MLSLNLCYAADSSKHIDLIMNFRIAEDGAKMINISLEWFQSLHIVLDKITKTSS